jgi:hypothetical protein
MRMRFLAAVFKRAGDTRVGTGSLNVPNGFEALAIAQCRPQSVRSAAHARGEWRFSLPDSHGEMPTIPSEVILVVFVAKQSAWYAKAAVCAGNDGCLCVR